MPEYNKYGILYILSDVTTQTQVSHGCHSTKHCADDITRTSANPIADHPLQTELTGVYTV